jgi:hypothetical protein
VGERFTKILPRIAGSDLREARAAAASAAAEGGEAKDAADAAMENGESSKGGRRVRRPSPLHTWQRDGERMSRGGRIRSQISERTPEEGDQFLLNCSCS